MKIPICPKRGYVIIGDVFIENCDGDEYLQMKTEEIESDCTYNAVSLVTGQMYEVVANTKVRRVYAELIITDIEEA